MGKRGAEPQHEINLVGRDEVMARLAELLQRRGALVLVGPAGIGKTALARAVLHREHAAGRLPRAVHLSIAGAADERALYDRTARAIGRDRARGTGARAATAFAELLSSSPCVIFWDDAHDADARAVSTLAHAVARPGNESRLLIAARYLGPGAKLPMLVVPPLSGDATRELVERLVRERGASLAEAIAKRARGNPLALRLTVAAAYDAPAVTPEAQDAGRSDELRLLVASEQLRAGDVEGSLRTLDDIDMRAVDRDLEARLRVLRARALARFGELKAAQRELEVVARASTSSPLVQVAFVALALLRAGVRGARERLALVPASLRAASSIEHQRALAYALSYFIEERYHRAVAWARRARRASGAGVPHSGARPSLVGAIEVLSLLQLDEIDRAVALVERGIDGAIASDAEEPLAAELTGLYHAAILGRRGDFEGCLAAAEPSYAALTRRSDHVPRAFLARYMARAAAGLGRFEQADALLRVAFGVASECGLDALVPLLERDAALLAEAAGSFEIARTRIRSAKAACGGSPFIRIEAWALDGASAPPPIVAGRNARAYSALRRAEGALTRGNVASAVEPAREAERHYQRQGAQFEHARALVALAEAQLRSGDFASARACLDAGDAIATPRGYVPVVVALAAVRASLADRTGALEEYVGSLARIRDARWPRGERVAKALERVGMTATVDRSTPLDDRVARLRLDRPAARVLATEASTFVLAREDAPPMEADLEVDLDRREARSGRTVVPMTAQRLALLDLLVTSGGATLEQIHLRVLGGRRYDPPRHRSTVYVAVARLRSALEPLVGKDGIVERSEERYRLRPDLAAAVTVSVDRLSASRGLASRLAGVVATRAEGG